MTNLFYLFFMVDAAGDNGAEKFYLGFRECVNEMLRFLVEKQGLNSADPIVVQIMKHLREQSQHFLPPSGKYVKGMLKKKNVSL